MLMCNNKQAWVAVVHVDHVKTHVTNNFEKTEQMKFTHCASLQIGQAESRWPLLLEQIPYKVLQAR